MCQGLKVTCPISPCGCSPTQRSRGVRATRALCIEISMPAGIGTVERKRFSQCMTVALVHSSQRQRPWSRDGGQPVIEKGRCQASWLQISSAGPATAALVKATEVESLQ